MKSLILILGLALAGSLTFTEKVHAYSTAAGVDPEGSLTGVGDLETKQYKKSTAAGFSDNISTGQALAYAGVDDGYTMTHIFTVTPVGERLLACFALDNVATGDTSYHRCATKGWLKVQYDATSTVVEEAEVACVSATGTVTGCPIVAPVGGGGVGGKPLATANLRAIVPLESKLGGTGTDLKVILNLQ